VRSLAAFPDLNLWGAADLIAEGDYVVDRTVVSAYPGRGRATRRAPRW
jgi:hypothetical protein